MGVSTSEKRGRLEENEVQNLPLSSTTMLLGGKGAVWRQVPSWRESVAMFTRSYRNISLYAYDGEKMKNKEIDATTLEANKVSFDIYVGRWLEHVIIIEELFLSRIPHLYVEVVT